MRVLFFAIVVGRAFGQGPATAGYVDSKLCGDCHAAIARTYEKTGMARAFYRPGSGNNPGTGAKPFYHAPTRAFYSMSQRDGKYYQRRWQAGPNGEEQYVQEWQIDFVMGSGNHVRTYLHRSANGTLIELPLAWYSENGGYWAMNPGYDTGHFITPRKITYECMFCHNAYPQIPAGHERANDLPVYLEPMPVGIDCQRCHGPGARHIQAAKAKAASLEKTIINPARLKGDQQMEVCMQCHLQTTSLRLPASIRRFDRGPFAYRAGEPLGNFELFFDRATDRAKDPEPKFEIVSSVVRLRQSKCFLAGQGAMTCLTCHDPHDIPRGEAATQHYNSVCRSCHAAKFDVLVSTAKHAAGTDCISCHMPKRRTDDVVHAVMTDHLIQRRAPGNLLAEIPEKQETDATAYRGEVVQYYPKSLEPLYLGLAQVEHGSNVDAGIAQLSAAIEKLMPALGGFYFQLGEAWRMKGDATKAAAAYEQALQRDPGSAWTLRRLADALVALRQPVRAETVLKSAIQKAPDDPKGWYALGELDAETGRGPAAIAAFQKSAQLDGEAPEIYNALGSELAQSGDLPGAEKAFRHALTVQPDLAGAQANLGMLLASKNDLPEAAGHFERALAAKPEDASARCNYAITLAQLNRPEDAEHQLRLAIETDPALAEAHDILGSLFRNEGRLDAAVQEYREAVRVRPQFSRAYLDLGIALAESGNMNGAAEELRRAAAGSDPAVKQQATQVLQQIGKQH
jgi:predicted CXXCH cytochrome family protein